MNIVRKYIRYLKYRPALHTPFNTLYIAYSAIYCHSMHWSLGSYISCHEFHRSSKRWTIQRIDYIKSLHFGFCFIQSFFKLVGSGEPTGDADYRHRMGAQLGEVPESIDVDAVAEMFFLTWDSGFHGGRIFAKNGWRNKYPSTANITWRKEIQHDTICIHFHGSFGCLNFATFLSWDVSKDEQCQCDCGKFQLTPQRQNCWSCVTPPVISFHMQPYHME